MKFERMAKLVGYWGLLGVVTSFSFLGAAEIKRTYHGITADAPEDYRVFGNPERGFRWENRFAEPWRTFRWLQRSQQDKACPITINQCYVELLPWAHSDRIAEQKIQQLEADFQVLRQNGLKTLLCFRYERKRGDKGPTCETILKHIAQLKGVLQRNMDVIFALQTGFVGMFGEWHHSTHQLEKNPQCTAAIVRALQQIFGNNRKFTIRYARHKNDFMKILSGDPKFHYRAITAEQAQSGLPQARLGFCNHGFMVGKTDAATFRFPEEEPYLRQESLFTIMEGELFWAESDPRGGIKDNGLEALKRYWLHHYTAFNYVHNNRDAEVNRKKNTCYSITEWKQDQVSREFLQKNHIPFQPEYFLNQKGQVVTRSIFEFARDHFGYRLYLTQGEFPDVAEAMKPYRAEFTLKNCGFAAPVNPRPVFLVVQKDSNAPIVLAELKTDVRKWYPCDPVRRTILSPAYRLKFQVKKFPHLAPGRYQLGIWLPDEYENLRPDRRYSIRLANRDIVWDSRGVNQVGEIVVK